ncbi:unnamed protein product [Paramecium sonneborni]|uniref:HECT-type E3 ubiquitin transferase n=1 Tax=Paramecium sonneborni TaxID=65129 RepID=A0A8S1LAU8_9CILI|nr:unnamed protein product [Paramecium sonneborni]
MKIPLKTFQNAKEFELRMLEFLLQSQSFLDDLMKVVDNQSHPVHKLSNGALILIINQLDQQIEIAANQIQENPNYECQMLLTLISCMMEFDCYRFLFNSFDHLFKMLENSDSLFVYEKIMLILIKLYKNPKNESLFNQLEEYIPRVIYFTRILFDHYNNLSSTKIDLIDYFNEDPQYKNLSETPKEFPQLILEYMDPSLLNESYQDLCINGLHKKELHQPIFIRNFKITEVNSIAALHLSKSFLDAQDQNFCPLIDAIKYKILIHKGLQSNKIQTITFVITLQVKSLLMYMLLCQFCLEKDCEDLLDQVFEEQLEYELHFRMFMKLFQLKTVEPQLLSNILLTLNEITKIEKENENNVAFSIVKNYDEIFLQLIYDVLSMHSVFIDIEQTYRLEYFPTLLSEQCARNQELAKNIFEIFSTEPAILLLNRSNIALASSSALIKSLSMQDNRLLLPPETFKAAIIFLSRISRQDDIQKDKRIFNDLIDIVENQIQFSTQILKPIQDGHLKITSEEADQIIATCIQSLNEHFKDDLGRRSNGGNGPTYARQISESQIIKKLQNLIEFNPNFYETIQQTLILVFYLANEVPTLIGRLIDSYLPQTLNQLISNLSIEKINKQMMMAIFSFYTSISLKEEGYEQFNKYGLQFLDNILYYFLINNIHVQREQLCTLAQCIGKFTQKIFKAQNQVCEILNNIIKQLWMNLNEKKKQLKISNIYQDYYSIIIQIQNLSMLSFNMFHNFTYSFLSKLIINGFFESLLKFFEFPTFDFKNELITVYRWFSQNDEFNNHHKILKQCLLTLENWEVYLGDNLEKAQPQINESYYNFQEFFSKCSQQQIQDNLQMVSHYSQVEYLLEILGISLLNCPEMDWNEKVLINLHNKCCSLLRIILDCVNQNLENCKNYQVLKKSVFNPFIKILQQIIVKTLRAEEMINQQSFINLLNYMSLKLKSSNLLIKIRLLSSIDKFFKYILKASQKKQINLIFISYEILKSGFRGNFQDAISLFTKLTIQFKEKSYFLNILSQHYSSIIKILYLNSFEYLNKKFGLQFLSYQILNITILLLIIQDSDSDYVYNIKFVLLEKIMRILSPTFLQDIQIKERDCELQTKFGVLNVINDNINNALCLSDNQEKVKQTQQEMKQNLQSEQQMFEAEQEIHIRQGELKNYIKQNILFFNKFEETLFKFIDGQMMPCLLKCLQKAVQEQFKLQLKFEDCDINLKQPEIDDMKLIITILHYIYKQQNFVQEHDYIVIEMMKLIQELLKYENEQTIQAVNHVLAILTLFITDEYQQKQQDQKVFHQIFEAVVQIMKGKIQNEITSKICIEILVRAFQINNENVHKFVYQMNGLEPLLKVKGNSRNQVYNLTKLVLSIVHDSTIVTAQIEAKIKKILYDQQYNLEIDRNNQIQQQHKQHLIQSPFKDQYPLNFLSIHYNIKIPNDIKLAKDNEALLAMQTQMIYNEQIQFVLNSLFEDQSNYFVLKKNVLLYTLDCVQPASFQKYKEPSSCKRSNKIPSSKKRKSGNKLQLQLNFKHTQETQILIKLLIQQMIVSYFEKTELYQFQWKTISQVLQVLIRRYPILIPQLVKINCSKFLKPYHKQLGFEYSEVEFPSKISFITLITKFMIPQEKLLFELCLDNLILNQISNNFIAPFSNEIRKKIINEIYEGIEKRIKILDQNFCYLSHALIYLIQIKSVAQICFKNENEQQNSCNFLKLYMEGIKSFDLKTFYKYENELPLLNESLGILLNVATYLLFSKPSKIPIISQKQEEYGVHFQLQGMVGQLLPEDINYQLTPNKGKIYQDLKKYFRKQPFLPLQFNEEINQDVRQDEIDQQMLWSPFSRRNTFLDIEFFDNIEEKEDLEIDQEDEDNYDQINESRYDSIKNQQSTGEQLEQIYSQITGQSGNNLYEDENTQNQNYSWTDEDDEQLEESSDEDLEESSDDDYCNTSNTQSELLYHQNLHYALQNLNQLNIFTSMEQNNIMYKKILDSTNHIHYFTKKEDLIFMKMTQQIIFLLEVQFSKQFTQILDKFQYSLPQNYQPIEFELVNWWTELIQQSIIHTLTDQKHQRLGVIMEQGLNVSIAHINVYETIRDLSNQPIQHSINSHDQSINSSNSISQQQNTSTFQSQNLQYFQSEQQLQQIQQHQSSSFFQTDFSDKMIKSENLNQFNEEPGSDKQISQYFDQSNIRQSPVQQQFNQQNNLNYSQIYPKSYNFLNRVGKKFDDLIKNDIDPSVFEDFNEDMMMEIISVIPHQTYTIDPTFLDSLPVEIRNQIIQQYFPSLNQLQQQQVQEEDLSQSVIERIQKNQDTNIPIQNPQENALNSESCPGPNSLIAPLVLQDQYRHKIQEQLKQFKKPHEKFQKLQNLLHNQRLLIQKLGNFDDDFTNSLLSLLYVESHGFKNFPTNLFISLCNNYIVENKLIDTLFFILKTKNLNEYAQFFPPKFLVQRNGLIRDFSKIYNVVSLKVLYLFSKLQGFSINYFFQSKKQNQDNENSREDDQICPLFQLIQFLHEFKGEHLEILIQAIMNISTKQKYFTQENAKLDTKSVECICKFLISNTNKNCKNFLNIIQSLCNNKENLISIVQYLQEYIEKSIQEINCQFQRQFQYHEIFNGGKTLFNVFQFIQEINLKLEKNINLQYIRLNFNQLLESSDLIELWKNIIKLLQQISTQEIIKLIPKISPYLECFFINYQIVNPQKIKKSNQKESIKKIAIMEGQNQDIQEQHLLDKLFEEICEKGKELLNMMIKERLQECKEKRRIKIDSLGIIISKNPRIVDFDNKHKYFKMKLKQLKSQNKKHRFENIIVRCRRKDIFMDSYHRISKLKPEELKGKLIIEFNGEEGIDQGGVSKEWFLMLSKEIFNPNYALFTPSLNGQNQPCSNSNINPDYKKYFKFIGRIVAKALYDEQLLETYFTRSFYKHILGQKLTIHDMEDIDLNEYKSMKKILDENVTDWGIYWTYTVDNFGKLEERELVEGGKQKQVTEDNKFDYVQTYCYQKMAKGIKDQIEAFLSGFHELIPQSLISMFEWKEMELMLCGLPDIDLEDMKENIEYHGYNSDDQVIQWLWELLESFDQSKRAAFLQFVTGTSKVPLGGFKDLKGIHGSQKIQIHKEYYIKYELPTSHTCFNQLILPCYPTRQVLIEKLELAILEGKESFGFA